MAYNEYALELNRSQVKVLLEASPKVQDLLRRTHTGSMHAAASKFHHGKSRDEQAGGMLVPGISPVRTSDPGHT